MYREVNKLKSANKASTYLSSLVTLNLQYFYPKIMTNGFESSCFSNTYNSASELVSIWFLNRLYLSFHLWKIIEEQDLRLCGLSALKYQI
jgi:hypothetical protein